jgi:hypothetical protein
MRNFIAVFFFLLGSAAFAHVGHHHAPHTQEMKEADAGTALKLAYGDIAANYDKSIRPIFSAKCAACHSLDSAAPWYSQIPGVHWLVERDRSEAKEHLEISKGFPFGGHGEPLEDLEAIEETTSKDEMPTTLYSIVHPSQKLDIDEKQKILNWVRESKARLAALKKTEDKP